MYTVIWGYLRYHWYFWCFWKEQHKKALIQIQVRNIRILGKGHKFAMRIE